eukprot:3667208-Pleurochrysis_carterae.AAC.1
MSRRIPYASRGLTILYTYVDTQLAAVFSYIDDLIQTTLETCREYTDNAITDRIELGGWGDADVTPIITQAQSYTDEVANTTLSSAQSYTDSAISNLELGGGGGDVDVSGIISQAVEESKTYTDTSISQINVGKSLLKELDD